MDYFQTSHISSMKRNHKLILLIVGMLHEYLGSFNISGNGAILSQQHFYVKAMVKRKKYSAKQ